MIKILYGVQGTGNGHTTRARVMAKAFAERDDVQVDYLFTGRPRDKYFDMEVFADFQTREGITFVTAKGEVDALATARNIRIGQFFKDVKELDLSGYDLVINDFEPVSAWAARRQNVPSISISHQAAFTHPVPRTGDSWLDRLLLRYFAPADINLGVHWYHFGQDIMPPFVEAKPNGLYQEGEFLVYLPFESLEEIKLLLAPFAEVQFYCFHPELKEDADEGHIHWRKVSKDRFQRHLSHCAGVIANGGFELSSECLKLGKKVLIKPLKGQFEQSSNVLTLTRMGLCHTMSTLDTDTLEQWLPISAPEPVKYPEDPEILVNWLIGRDWQNTDKLCAALWEQVEFPDDVRRRLAEL